MTKNYFFFAVHYHKFNAAEELLDYVKDKEEKIVDMLMEACRKGDAEIVQWILNKQPNLKFPPGKIKLYFMGEGGSLTFQGSLNSHTLELPSQYKEADAIRVQGENIKAAALFYAACHQQNEIMKILLDNKASMSEKQFAANNTVLIKASACGWVNVVELLISYGAIIDEGNIKNETALMYAAHSGHHNIVKLLLAHGASTTKIDNGGCNALHYAKMNNHHEVVKILQSAAATPMHNIAAAKNPARAIGTPGQYAFEQGMSYFRTKNFWEAIKCFQQAIKLEPFTADYYEYCGYAYANANSELGAIWNYEDALLLDPSRIALEDEMRTLKRKYYAYYIQNDTADIKDIYTHVPSTDIELRRRYLARFVHMVEAGNYESALGNNKDIGNIRQLCEGNQDIAFIEGVITRGIAYAKTKKYTAALEDLDYIIGRYDFFRDTRNGTKKDDYFWKAWYQRGLIYLEQNNLDAALRDFKKAQQLNPEKLGPRLGLLKIEQKLAAKRGDQQINPVDISRKLNPSTIQNSREERLSVFEKAEQKDRLAYLQNMAIYHAGREAGSAHMRGDLPPPPLMYKPVATASPTYSRPVSAQNMTNNAYSAPSNTDTASPSSGITFQTTYTYTDGSKATYNYDNFAQALDHNRAILQPQNNSSFSSQNNFFKPPAEAPKNIPARQNRSIQDILQRGELDVPRYGYSYQVAPESVPPHEKPWVGPPYGPTAPYTPSTNAGSAPTSDTGGSSGHFIVSKGN